MFKISHKLITSILKYRLLYTFFNLSTILFYKQFYKYKYIESSLNDNNIKLPKSKMYFPIPFYLQVYYVRDQITKQR